MRNIVTLSAAALFVFCAASCNKEKEDAVLPKAPQVNVGIGNKTVAAEFNGFLKSLNLKEKQESLPFFILSADAKDADVTIGLCYIPTEAASRFSVIWDGMYEVRNDSTVVNLTIFRENTGVLIPQTAEDSCFVNSTESVNLTKMGIDVEKLHQARSGIRIQNASFAKYAPYASNDIYIKLYKKK
jgi:hypothetical protein